MIDLHIHTTYSDGLDTVKDILLKAQKMNLNTISITDHDTCRAYNELENINYKNIYSGNIIKGIEISSKYKGHKIELLAYNFDDYKSINNLLAKSNYHNNTRMYYKIKYERIKLINKFINLGLSVDSYYLDNLFINAFESNLYNSILQTNDINKVKEILKDNYFATGYQFYRKCVTSPETPFYIDYTILNKNIDEICNIIHKYDGLVFLAHPYLYGMKNILTELENIYKNYPIDGIECYYNGFNEEQINSIKDFAYDNKLLISGGSDYHAKGDFKNQLGYSMQGKALIDKKIIDDWNIQIKSINSKRHILK